MRQFNERIVVNGVCVAGLQTIVQPDIWRNLTRNHCGLPPSLVINSANSSLCSLREPFIQLICTFMCIYFSRFERFMRFLNLLFGLFHLYILMFQLLRSSSDLRLLMMPYSSTPFRIIDISIYP